jgi:hypothetical protein
VSRRERIICNLQSINLQFYQGELAVAAIYNHEQIRAALALTEPAISSYLDLETGQVVQIDEGDSGPATEAMRTLVMDGYGERYRYIPGGNSAADEAAVATWLEAEGL